jgi:cobalt/nickel transport system permease protein
MHIPDGFLSASVVLSTCAVSFGVLGFCLKKAATRLKDRMVPLMGVMSAFIFAAQMLNFPVVSGTSGHLIGAVLAAVLLGPFGAVLVVSVVLIAQCLFFQDGGVTALGANILNMAVLGCLSGYFVYKAALWRKTHGCILFGVALASWVSVGIGALAASLELAFSGTVPLSGVLPAMIGIHALIGVGEAILTCLVISFILKVRPDLMYSDS